MSRVFSSLEVLVALGYDDNNIMMMMMMMTRRPCYRKATARCRSFRFDVCRYSLQFSEYSQASKARLQSSRDTGEKAEFNVKWSFKVIYFGVSGKATRASLPK